ncbi:MAG: PfkB family carbohydrate kinase [Propionivibrio sp.]
MSIVSVCLTPGIQRSVALEALSIGEVNRLKTAYVDVSGKGVNVCRVLQRLKIPACCLSQGGSNADELMLLAQREGLNLRLIPSAGMLRTCTSIIETSPGGGCRVTELIEPSPTVEQPCIQEMTRTVKASLATAQALVIAGSIAPGFPGDYQAKLTALAREANVPVFLDLQGAPLRAAIAERPALVKINLSEFVATFLADRFQGGEHSGVLAQPVLADEILDAVADVSRRHATAFVLTRGANSILIVQDGDVRAVPVKPLPVSEVFNPIGSGDAFLAGMLAQLIAATPSPDRHFAMAALERACVFATACAQSNARTARPGFLEDAFALDYRA